MRKKDLKKNELKNKQNENAKASANQVSELDEDTLNNVSGGAYGRIRIRREELLERKVPDILIGFDQIKQIKDGRR